MTNRISNLERKLYGEVETPITLVNEMLDKLPKEVWTNPNLKWLDNSTGAGIFIKVIVDRLMFTLPIKELGDDRYRYIMENMIYVAELQERNCELYTDNFDPKGEYNLNVYNGSFLENGFDTHIKDVWGIDKFDIVVMNPPYTQMIDMDFIEKSYKLSDIVLCVHPSTWLLDEKGVQKKFLSAKNLVRLDLVSIELFNGNGVFGISLFVPCVITYINKNREHKRIECIDRINNVIVNYKSIYDINKFSDTDRYPTLKDKIKSLCLFSVKNYIKTQGDKKYYVNLAQIRGHVKHTEELGRGMDKEMVQDDFYTMVTKDATVSLVKKQQAVGFDTEIEAQNFLKYVKTDFARFCLAIYKNNGNLHRGELGLIPFLPFTKEWTDEQLYWDFNITKGDVELIEKYIPKYY